MCALVVDKNLACILFGLLGVLFASSFAICRSFYSTIIPAAERAEYFSVYVIFERIGAVIGPLIWSLTVSSFMFLGESTAYRIAMACTAIITSISIFALEKVRKIQISAQSSLTN